MRYLKFFENYGNKLTIEYLKDNFPIEMDDYFLANLGKERFFVMIDDKPSYFSDIDGINSTKTYILNILKGRGMITDERIDTPIIKEHLRSSLNSKKFIWIHGLPGSGKSFLSTKIQSENSEKSYQLLDDIYDIKIVKNEIDKDSNIILTSPYFENYIKWTKMFEKLNQELDNQKDYFVKHIWFKNDLEACIENLEQRKEHKIASLSILMEIRQYSKDYIIPARATTIPVYSNK